MTALSERIFLGRVTYLNFIIGNSCSELNKISLKASCEPRERVEIECYAFT